MVAERSYRSMRTFFDVLVFMGLHFVLAVVMRSSALFCEIRLRVMEVMCAAGI